MDEDLAARPDLLARVAAGPLNSGFRRELLEIGNPYRRLAQTRAAILSFLNALTPEVERWEALPEWHDSALFQEILLEIRDRWSDLLDSWYDPASDRYDISKVPDLVDNIRFDLIHHNAHLGAALHPAFEIYRLVKAPGNIVAPLEYGLTSREKVEIAVTSNAQLVEKVLKDLDFFETDQPAALRVPSVSQVSKRESRPPDVVPLSFASMRGTGARTRDPLALTASRAAWNTSQ
eukprot:Polyplicarium_translucidae@DN679_c0_g1_i1.p2